MKGVVFTVFIDWVEKEFSLETADKILTSAKLESGGAYTAVGTYDHKEMLSLVSELHKATQRPVGDILFGFGRALFDTFLESYPSMFHGHDSAFGFLGSIEGYIHVEVNKLYPDAELPRFTYPESSSPDEMVMVYQSTRCLGRLAEGLIEASIAHYGVPISVSSEASDGGRSVRFLLKKEAA